MEAAALVLGENMGNEYGEWIMYGVSEDDPYRIKSVEELIDYINEIGFLPLFRNSVPGFSVEERTLAGDWWSGDMTRDPWEWREIIAAGGQVAYGKFFAKKAGFISLAWLPYFTNWRRDGYDFDARWEDAKASHRSKRVMDLFMDGQELFSFEAKQRGGFGKGGEKNFEGTVTELQMQTYLVIRDFRRKINQAGLPYGWSIAVYSTPEHIWGEELVCSAYHESPAHSKGRIYQHIRETYPIATEHQLRRVLG